MGAMGAMASINFKEKHLKPPQKCELGNKLLPSRMSLAPVDLNLNYALVKQLRLSNLGAIVALHMLVVFVIFRGSALHYVP